MITYPINKQTKPNEIPFHVKGTMTINKKKIDTLFLCYAPTEEDAKDCLKRFRDVNIVKYNMRTLAKHCL
jgi:hypothetical protein